MIILTDLSFINLLLIQEAYENKYGGFFDKHLLCNRCVLDRFGPCQV